MSDKKDISILPAILPRSLDDLREHVELLSGTARHYQVDVVDGQYARGKTWPYRDRSSFEKIVEQEHGLPLWENIDYQFDLMVEDPMVDLKNFLQAGATSVVLHARSRNVEQALQVLVDMRTDEIGTYAVRAGIALSPTDQPDILEPFEAQFDFVQVMGIDREGRQGEPFDKKALYLVERVRARYPNLLIQVDGAVTTENARSLVLAGATRLVVGHAIFEAEDPVAAYKELYTIANGA